MIFIQIRNFGDHRRWDEIEPSFKSMNESFARKTADSIAQQDFVFEVRLSRNNYKSGAIRNGYVQGEHAKNLVHHDTTLIFAR